MQKLVIGAITFVSYAQASKLTSTWRETLRQEGRAVDKESFKFVCEDGFEMDSFLKWAAKFDKDYSSPGSFNQRLENWVRNNLTIREFNKQSMGSGEKNNVMLDHNGNSDKSYDELSQKLGLMAAPKEP